VHIAYHAACQAAREQLIKECLYLDAKQSAQQRSAGSVENLQEGAKAFNLRETGLLARDSYKPYTLHESVTQRMLDKEGRRASAKLKRNIAKMYKKMGICP
jgi:hypothetical protein